MRIYVAGKWFDKPLVQSYIEKFTAMGHTITHNWTLIEDGNRETLDELADMAEWDIEGVRSADVVVILIKDPIYPYRGTCCEMGAALACRKPVIAVNLCGVVPDFYRNVFAKHKLIKWTTESDPDKILNVINQN